jgi:hypothetical protein
MRQVRQVRSWVVYETPATSKMARMQCVCEQAEWEQLKQNNPALTLVRSGFTSEGEAERVARDGTPSLQTGPRRYRSA